jgi:hypothetical protein
MVSEIFVEVRSNYGCRAVYPLCTTSTRLAALAGHKTLTPESISLIKALGYSIVVKQQEVTL